MIVDVISEGFRGGRLGGRGMSAFKGKARSLGMKKPGVLKNKSWLKNTKVGLCITLIKLFFFFYFTFPFFFFFFFFQGISQLFSAYN